jgi:hypothetical protein
VFTVRYGLNPKNIKHLLISLKVYCKELIEYEYGCNKIITDDNDDTTNNNLSRKNDVTSCRPVQLPTFRRLGCDPSTVGNC